MITKFAVKNYRGFADRIEWDLSHPSSYSFNTFAIKDGIVKNGIIYGPNGSGKSNLALAVFDIILHLTQKAKNPHQFEAIINALHPNPHFNSFEVSISFFTPSWQLKSGFYIYSIEREFIVFFTSPAFAVREVKTALRSFYARHLSRKSTG